MSPVSTLPARLNVTVMGTQLAGMRRRPGQTLMTGLSVLLATFVVFATVLAYQITTRTFLDSFSDTTESTTLVAESPADAFTARQLAQVRAVPGVAEAAGRISGSLSLAGQPDRQLDLVADPGSGPMAKHQLVSGDYPDGPNEVAVSAATARQLALTPGSRLRLQRDSGDVAARPRPVVVTVTGLVDSTAADEAYAPDATVAALLAQDSFARLDLRADKGVSASVLSERVGPLLAGTGPEVTVTPGDQVREREAKEQVRQFDVVFALIGMFLMISVIAAALVATSTFRIVFAQRLRQLALLRTIGTQQGQLSRALAGEGALTGLLAGAVGVISAFVVVQVARAVAATAGKPLAASGFPVPAAALVLAGAVLITLGSVIAPALSAADVSPLQALRSADTSTAQRGIGPLRALIGLLLGLAAVATAAMVLTALPMPGQRYDALASNLLKIVVSGTLAFGALIALGPLLLRGLLAVVARPLRRAGLTAELAAEDLRSMPRRAAAVSVVVALGITLIVGTIVGAASIRTYVDSGLALRAPADFAVSPDEGHPPPAVLRRMAADPALAHVIAYRTASLDLPAADPESSLAVTDLDLDALPALTAISPAVGTVTDLRDSEVVLSDRASFQLKLTVGDRIALHRGGPPFTVRAVLSGNGPLNSDLVVTATALDALAAPLGQSGAFADAATAGVDGRDGAEQHLRAILQKRPGTSLTVLAELGDGTGSAVSKLFAAALGLIGLTVLIAVVGVGTTMSLTVMERTREFGLLRALGLGRSGLRAMIGIESGLYGLIGAIMGLVLGVPYAWLSLLALNLNARLQLPLGQLLTVLVVLSAVTVLAGLLPTRRAVRVSPIVALGAGS
ncbi:MAG TPA: FtsX-like permease family protein [Propionibacteriaceae bacterium]|nr:FtsX-like permease family protein [Propionibacteriaceae bacterium]